MIRFAATASVAMGIVALVAVFPWVLDAALARLGTRWTAACLLGFVLISVPLRWRAPAASPIAAAGLAGLLLGAAVTDDRMFLQLVPAWIYVGLAWFCASSLRGGDSLIERGARWLVPEAPEFIRDYCRVITALWGVFFVVCAAVIGGLAIAGSAPAWRTFTGRTIWGVMAAVSALEFFVRKTWFRYYFRNGVFDRFWARLFPAEATARGRQSQAAICAYRERLRDRDRLAANEVPPTDA